ncbi:MAG: GTP cyclohydrolase I FolE2 [Bdellovibrionaceae bacterium]|nr:GTP cyclohydrolase I FolE2 [Bdellovibrio sp.]
MNLLPDVMIEKSDEHLALSWVGMTQIQTALQVKALTVPAQLDVGVNLLENNRGIHMSRLYQLQQTHILNQKISSLNFQNFLKNCLESQAEISQSASAQITMQWPLTTVSLKSALPGFRLYPVQLIFQLNQNEFKCWTQFEILYSSTCPQSAKVAMEVNRHENPTGAFDRFLATPHAQRSRALIRVQINEFTEEQIEKLVLNSEAALGTPVQTAVKKSDEMEFAKLNAQNLMFCEDAVRKLSVFLRTQKNVLGFYVLCEHQESLHPHNATAVNAYNYSAPATLQFAK